MNYVLYIVLLFVWVVMGHTCLYGLWLVHTTHSSLVFDETDDASRALRRAALRCVRVLRTLRAMLCLNLPPHNTREVCLCMFHVSL